MGIYAKALQEAASARRLAEKEMKKEAEAYRTRFNEQQDYNQEVVEQLGAIPGCTVIVHDTSFEVKLKKNMDMAAAGGYEWEPPYYHRDYNCDMPGQYLYKFMIYYDQEGKTHVYGNDMAGFAAGLMKRLERE